MEVEFDHVDRHRSCVSNEVKETCPMCPQSDACRIYFLDRASPVHDEVILHVNSSTLALDMSVVQRRVSRASHSLVLKVGRVEQRARAVDRYSRGTAVIRRRVVLRVDQDLEHPQRIGQCHQTKECVQRPPFHHCLSYVRTHCWRTRMPFKCQSHTEFDAKSSSPAVSTLDCPH
jgi:hypothetical protein